MNKQRSEAVELERLLLPFYQQAVRDKKPGPVYSATCCGRTFVGMMPATICRTCKKTPAAVEHTIPEMVPPALPDCLLSGIVLQFVVLHHNRFLLEGQVTTQRAHRRINYEWKPATEGTPEIDVYWPKTVLLEAQEQDVLEANPHLNM